MVVTEVAIFHSNSGGFSAELKQALVDGIHIQNEWAAETFPDSPSVALSTRTVLFQQVEDPAKIMLLAGWDSVEQHHQWLSSSVNKSAMGKMQDLVTTEGENAFVLLHIEADILHYQAPSGSTSVLDSPIRSVGRMFVEADKRDKFQKILDENIGNLEVFAKPHLVQGGWRVDKEAESKDEYVMLAGWDTVDRHMAFAQTPEFAKYGQIRQFLAGADIKHYKRVW